MFIVFRFSFIVFRFLDAKIVGGTKLKREAAKPQRNKTILRGFAPLR